MRAAAIHFSLLLFVSLSQTQIGDHFECAAFLKSNSRVKDSIARILVKDCGSERKAAATIPFRGNSTNPLGEFASWGGGASRGGSTGGAYRAGPKGRPERTRVATHG